MLDNIRSKAYSLSDELDQLDPEDPKYGIIMGHIQKLLELEILANRVNEGVRDLDNRPTSSIGKILENPALLAILGNLTGILLILNYEKTESITTRAFSFIRPK